MKTFAQFLEDTEGYDDGPDDPPVDPKDTMMGKYWRKGGKKLIDRLKRMNPNAGPKQGRIRILTPPDTPLSHSNMPVINPDPETLNKMKKKGSKIEI